MSASTQEIVKALHTYFELRDTYRTAEKACKAYHMETLIPMAVELGMDQTDALQGMAKAWLDGYLVATGFSPERRDQK